MTYKTNTSRGGYAMAARILALVATTGTAAVTLLLPMSSAARSLGGSIIGEAVTWLTLAMALLGWADIVWHDVRGRLILPRLDTHLRHHLCVLMYHGLAAAWGLRSLVIVASDVGQPLERMVLGCWYLGTAIAVGILSVVMALDETQ